MGYVKVHNWPKQWVAHPIFWFSYLPKVFGIDNGKTSVFPSNLTGKELRYYDTSVFVEVDC